MKLKHIGLILIFGMGISCGKNGYSGESKDEKEVRLVIQKRYKALNQVFFGDVSLMLEVWSRADDVTYMGPGGGIKVGWSEVQKDWKSQAALKLGGYVSPSNMHVVINKDIAIVVNDEIGKNLMENGVIKTVSIRATHVLRRENGEWKIISEHTDRLSFL